MGLGTLTSKFIYSHGPAQAKQQVGYYVIGALWCMDKPWANTDSQDSPQPRLGEASTFLFIIYSLPDHGTNTQMSFCPGSPEIPIAGTLMTLGAHNFVCRPLIEMKF
jgi:hypothetical protein